MSSENWQAVLVIVVGMIGVLTGQATYKKVRPKFLKSENDPKSKPKPKTSDRNEWWS